MSVKNMWRLATMTVAAAMILAACATPTAAPQPTTAPPEPEATEAPAAAPPAEPFVFGMLLVGLYNDHGWSQAHFEAGEYVAEKSGAEMVYLDKVNPADRPGTTPDQLAGDLTAQGAPP